MSAYYLSEQQVQEFVSDGYLVVEDCFNPERYAHWLEQSLNSAVPGISLENPATWTPVFERSFRPGVFSASSGQHMECKYAVPKVWNILSRLLGENRIEEPLNWNGDFEINLDRYPNEEWTEPGPKTRGWHLDWWDLTGYLDNCWPSILVFAYWNDVGPKEGGTYLCPDSLKYVAKRLRNHPEGLNKYGELADGTTWRDDIPLCNRFVELVGSAGSVAFVNGMMLHAASANKSGKARVMSRSIARLKEPPNLNRHNADEFSPYEQSLLHVLGEERVKFERVTPSRTQDSRFKDGKPVGIIDN
ncbi:MAG TPA: hypothetical protein DCY55_01200 [Gammaproteobacteria bacterium]|nr:hypothetical protein [Gammaproteobacteria bacterium]